MVQPLNNNPMAKKLDIAIPQGLPATTQVLNDSIACRRANDATIQAEVSITARVLDDSMTCRQSPQGLTTRGLRIGLKT